LKKRSLLNPGMSVEKLLAELKMREEGEKPQRKIDPFKRRGKIKTFSAKERKEEEVRRIITRLEDSDKSRIIRRNL